MNPLTIRGTIARRVLVNYRVDADVLATHLPAPFQPKLVNGFGIAGICLIRLEDMRPGLAPAAIGFASENAAHRVAVEWDEGTETKEGVYIPIRHTNSRFNAAVGGRFFPGKHLYAPFWTAESTHRVKVEAGQERDHPLVRIAGPTADQIARNSVFNETETASNFFQCGSVGWSLNRAGTGFEGLKLIAENWNIQPLHVEHLISSWFDDPKQFPTGSAEFDSAFLMRNIAHEWQALPPLIQTKKEAA